MAVTHDQRFPGESAAYRQARNALLQSELALHKQVLAVAEQRRKLPLGGAAKDYVFEEGPASLDERGGAKPVHLAGLFAPGQDTLLLYSFMYGPHMEQPCPMCSSFLDGLNGNAKHLRQRVSLAVAAKSPLERIRDFGRVRGWRNLRLLSSANTAYNADFHGESEDGNQIPMMTVFVRRDGVVHHFYSTESVFVPAEGHDPCHLDLMWPLWNALDLTPGGRGEDWYPPLA